MVYESDFYTTRRPYSRPTPSITSYTVTTNPEKQRSVAYNWPASVYGFPNVPVEMNPNTIPRLVAYNWPSSVYGFPSVPDGINPYNRDPQERRLVAYDWPASVYGFPNVPVEMNPYTPRHYVVTDTADHPRRAEQQYSYSYTSTSESTKAGGSAPPSRNYSSSTERVQRATGSGPGSTYHSTTERTSRSSDYPGSYNHSYSSTTSGRLPGGTSYRHFSYRV